MDRHPTRRVAVPVLAAVLLPVLVGCSGDDETSVTSVTSAPSSSTATTTSTTSSTTSTSTPSTTTTVAPTTVPETTPPTTPPATPPPTTVPASGCAALPPLAAGIVETAARIVDVDADGIGDTVRSYATGPTPVAGDWHLRVELAAGGGVDVTLPDDPAPGAVTALGGSYVGSTVEPGPGGMRPAIFATTGAGASASIVTLFWLDGCSLVPMTVGGGGAATFPVGAGVVHAESLYCEGTAGTTVLVYREIVTDDGGASFDVTLTPYTRAAADLVLFGAGAQTTTEPAMPAVPRLIDCPGVDDP